MPFLVESIWVRMERQSARSTWIHVRLYLHGGEERPFVVAVGKPPQGALALGNADFRSGEERGYTARRQIETEPVAV